MHKLIPLLVFAMLALSIGGCHMVYTPDVQQGNLLDKTMVEQLKPGMTKRQVVVLMGTPSVTSPFQHDRWDYVSTQARRGGPMKVRTFTLTFNNDTLVRTEGDFFAQDAEALVKESRKYHAATPEEGGARSDKDASPKKDDGGLGSGTSNPSDDQH